MWGFVCISGKNDLLSLAQSGLNDNFHWYVCSSFCNRSRVVSRAIYFRKSSGRSKSEAPKQGHAKKFQNYVITPKESIYLKQLKFFKKIREINLLADLLLKKHWSNIRSICLNVILLTRDMFLHIFFVTKSTIFLVQLSS